MGVIEVIFAPDKVYFHLYVPNSHKGISVGANNSGYLRGVPKLLQLEQLFCDYTVALLNSIFRYFLVSMDLLRSNL